ncbi:MAG: hypothetical protein ACREA7_05315 [Nitrosotalea sp.]
MAKIMATPDEASESRLAGILEGYLREEKWCTDKRLEGEIYKSHSPETLKKVLENQRFSYLSNINPARLAQVKMKFLEQ